jgi:integrase
VCEWKLLTSSPLKHVKKLAVPRGRTRFLSKEERKLLLKMCREGSCAHLYPINLIAFLTGMRRGEILGLQWKDIDPEHRRLTLHRNKNGDRRIFPLIGPLLETLQELAALQKNADKDDFLFAGRSGKAPLNFRQSWKIALSKANIFMIPVMTLFQSWRSWVIPCTLSA